MPNDWSKVPLDSVVCHRKQFIEINDLDTYKRCRVRTRAQGIVLRDIVTGADVKTKRQQVCRAGEFLLAEIDAKVGGFGIVPPDLDGAIVSSHYFLFGLKEELVTGKFLGYFVRTPEFQDQVSAQGSTNYAAVRPADVLKYMIPLPPLDEQRRIVERIEELTAKIEKAHELRAQASKDMETLLPATRALVFGQASLKGTVRFDQAALLERGKFSHRPRNDPAFFSGSHPWIQIAEIEAADKYIPSWNQTLNDLGLSVSRKFPKGTVLVSIAATIGSSVRYPL
jgi:type I restriction enzyme, S subunit